MNWRRGLLLAGINLIAAVPLIVSVELRDAAYVRDYYVPRNSAAEIPAAVPSPTPEPKDEGVSINFCNVTDEFSLQEQIVIGGNEPAFALTGWRRFCPARWQLSGILHTDGLAPPTPSSMAVQRKVDIGLFLSIALQWILVGGFPLRRPQKPWREPGMFITICAVLSGALVFIPAVAELARLPALFAAFAWFWWFGLLMWKCIRSGWRWTARRGPGTRKRSPASPIVGPT